ncbi:DUF4924 family protein [Sunxiuqinia sp. A32]|uniref:DUF4924 family protein n=1 Tax=Sunxiuqinia sp. A32 TaxID=3461496 RepID=UPI004045D176
MLIAKEKRRQNIAEYVLYMWQLEDIFRALNYDLGAISNQLVVRFGGDEDKQLEIYDWYKNLVVMMEKEQIKEKGHLQFITNLINDINQFHLILLQSSADSQYRLLYQLAKPVIEEFRQKSETEKDHDIQVALHALYTMMLLKLQKKEITVETKQAMSHISKMIAHLSARYLQYERGDFDV